MRARFWALIVATLALVALATALAGCAGRVARVRTDTPVPTKTLRPTFTATIPKPTLTPSPTAGQGNTQPAAPAQPAEAPTVEPTATPAPPTAEPATQEPPTPEPVAAFSVNSASVNVRSGPGTAFPVIGRLNRGQSFPITGKNEDGSWWQFAYNGKTGWVIGSNVSTTSTAAVEIAANIPRPPTAAPQPTARPAAPQPTARPAAPAQPSTKYALTGKNQLRTNTNPIVSVWCFVVNNANTELVPGTIRVLQGGAVVKEQAFIGGRDAARGDAGYSSEYLYNPGCKVELPAADGQYNAYLIEGGGQVSDVFTWTVSGESNRTAIIEWKLK